MSRLTDALLDNLNKTLGAAGVAFDHLQRITQGLSVAFQQMGDALRHVLSGVQVQTQQQQAPTPQVYPILQGSQILQPTPATAGVTDQLRESLEKLTAAILTLVMKKDQPVVQQKDEADRIFEQNQKDLEKRQLAEEKEKKEREQARNTVRNERKREEVQDADEKYQSAARRQESFGRFARALPGSMAGAAVSVGKSVAGAASDPAGAITPLLSIVESLTGMFGRLSGMTRRYAEALSPVAGMMFDRAMRDMSATIGVALLPVFNALTQGVRAVSAALLPAMERLKPAFESIGGTFLKVIGTVANTVGSIFQSLTPLFNFAAEVYDAISPMVQAVVAVFSGLVKAVASLFTDAGLKSTAEALKTAFQHLASATILVAAQMAIWVGRLTGSDFGNKFIAGIRQALGTATGDDAVAKKSADGMAPTGASTNDFSSFTSMVARSALTASTGGAPEEKKSEEWLKDLDKKLGEIQAYQKDFIAELVDKAGQKFGDILKNGADPIYKDAGPGMQAGGAAAELLNLVASPGLIPQAIMRRMTGS